MAEEPLISDYGCPSSANRSILLELTDVDTGYGRKQVLYGLSLTVYKGEIVALIGANGAGKSTALKVAFGLLPTWKGKIFFAGSPIQGDSPVQNIKRGISFAPQGGRVFDDLTVLENLETGGFHLPVAQRSERLKEIFQLFPVLAERAQDLAGKLSGGQQQTLALGRALVSKPTLLILDEPSLGLSPNLVSVAFEQITQINQKERATILIVEQKVRAVLDLCHRVYGLKHGRCVLCSEPNDLKSQGDKLRKLFL